MCEHYVRHFSKKSLTANATGERVHTSSSAADPKVEGRLICLELMQQFAEMPGVAGVHLMAPLNDRAIAPVIEEFRGGRGGR